MNRLSNDAYYLSLLAGVAARSTCLRRQVGAIVVDENHRVLSMGFNGVPKGFPHCGEILEPLKPDHTGFVPLTFKNVQEIERRERTQQVKCEGQHDPKGDTRRCMAVHAELNALLTCSDLRHAHAMYVSATPCKQCALAIANTGIKRVVCLEVYADDARHILLAAHIQVVRFPDFAESLKQGIVHRVEESPEMHFYPDGIDYGKGPDLELEASLNAPCKWCGYNGPGYWQAGTHNANCPWSELGGKDSRLKVIQVINQLK